MDATGQVVFPTLASELSNPSTPQAVAAQAAADQKAAADAEAAKVATDKASALAKLTALGLSEKEAKAIVG
jgi:hypothetical protein